MNQFQLLFKRAMLLSFTFLFITVSFSMIRAAGEVDPTFNAAVQNNTAIQYGDGLSTVRMLAVQPDGKIIAAGIFTVANNTGRTGIVRFNTDGSVDQSFNPPDLVALFTGYRINAVTINAVAVQSNGKVLLGGSFVRVNGLDRKNLIRLNADGSLDATFNPALGTAETISDIKIQPDGQIVYSGSIAVSGGGQGLTRLNPDGSTDLSLQFNRQSRVDSFLIQADGKFIINSTTNSTVGIYRANSDGSFDNSFAAATVNLPVYKIVLQPDGKILLGGTFATVNGTQRGRLARLNSDGSLDTSFNSGTGANSPVWGIDVLPDGKIVIGGAFLTYNGTSRVKNARLNSDGSLDTNFNYSPQGFSTVYAIASTGDGRVILGGNDTEGIWSKLSRINADGSLDAGFAAAIYQVGGVSQVLKQSDGKVLVVGDFSRVNGIFRPNIIRLNADGSIDTGFNPAVSSPVTAIALQPNGKILVATTNIVRLNSDGSLDFNFQSPSTTLAGGRLRKIIVQSDGKILVAGAFILNNQRIGAMRLNTNGTEDAAFNRTILSDSSPFSEVLTMKTQPDGKIVIGGFFSQLNGASRGNLARLNADGTLDTSFNLVFGGISNKVNDLALQSNGSIIIGGDFSSVNGQNYYYFVRILSDGTLDTSFNPGPNGQIYAVAVQPDDKIIIGGVFDAVGGSPRSKITRLNPNGTLDATFTASANDFVRNISLQDDGNILVSGDFNRVNGVSSVGIARLLNPAARTPFDFDGDGRADVSVFRPSNGVWYLNQSTSGFTGAAFGVSTDKLVPADYDGDGKTDLAVVRNGVWYLQRSSLGFTGLQFGVADDIPVPADYDGDGKADVAVFRPSNGTWYLQQSTAGFVGIQLGVGTDKPVPGDYNGDGRAEVAVYRPSNGTWYLSTNPATGFGGVVFGASTDVLVPADYDGDGKTDLAVFRPSNGTWYIQRSTAGFIGVQFGVGTDLPVPADYDGDGKADIAVVRNGSWYLNRSTQGFTGITFGFGDDKPLPNVFVR